MKKEPEDNGESWRDDLIFGIGVMLALMAPFVIGYFYVTW